MSDFYVATLSGHRRTVELAPSLARGQAPRMPAGRPQAIFGTPHPVTVGSLSGSGQWRAVLLRRPGTNQLVLVGVSLDRVDATLARLRAAVWGAGGLVLLVLAASGFWLERLGLRPVAEAAGVAEAISGGDRSKRLRIGTARTEAAQLGRAFNVMLDELQADEDRLRRFVADASHELRTPVSAIRGVAELWSQGDLRQGPAVDEAMRRIGQEARRLADLVEDLLLLTRLDERPALEQTLVDLRTLAGEAVAEAAALHPSRQISLVADSPVEIYADERALRQVVGNLVENALVHTASTSPVELRVGARPEVAILEVADGGPGMEPAEAARAFERFWRANASRFRPGAGLGLPIVAGLVNAHGGHVALDSGPEWGTVVRVVLPSDSPEAAPGPVGRTADTGVVAST